MATPEEQLAEAFADLARQLQAEKDPEGTRDRVTAAAIRTVEGCDAAAISLVHRRGGISTVAATSRVPEQVDAIQYETGQGPCLQAMADHEVFLSDDLLAETRWPRFSERAVTETGVRSMLSFRLFVQADTIGALNLYARHTAAFGDRARSIGAVLAAHSAIALAAATQREHAGHLAAALLSNRHIGMAIGILMAREQMTQDRAFAALRNASQHLNVKLRDVAEGVIETGTVPGPKPDPKPDPQPGGGG